MSRLALLLCLALLLSPVVSQGSGDGGGGDSGGGSDGGGSSYDGGGSDSDWGGGGGDGTGGNASCEEGCYIALSVIGGVILLVICCACYGGKMMTVVKASSNRSEHSSNLEAAAARAQKAGRYFFPREQKEEWVGWIRGSNNSSVNEGQIPTSVRLTFRSSLHGESSQYQPSSGRVDGHGHDRWGNYDVNGGWSDTTGIVTWNKSYHRLGNPNASQVSHPVQYTGYFDGDKIFGVWSIDDSVFEQGTFELTKPAKLLTRRLDESNTTAHISNHRASLPGPSAPLFPVPGGPPVNQEVEGQPYVLLVAPPAYDEVIDR